MILITFTSLTFGERTVAIVQDSVSEYSAEKGGLEDLEVLFFNCYCVGAHARDQHKLKTGNRNLMPR